MNPTSLAAAAVSALALAACAAAEPRPEPSNDTRLVQLISDAPDTNFVPVDMPAAQDGKAQFWTLSVEPAPVQVGEETIVAAWLHVLVDCGQNTVAHMEGVALRRDLSVGLRENRGSPAKVATRADKIALVKHACSRSAPLGPEAENVAAAVRLGLKGG